ncbi:MAG: undecaprenyl-diphosphate phosphatase [Actinomycetes bacterium]
MSWLQALVLGISQGLTEFLPVSSSAHTLIVSRLFNWPDPGAAFTAVTQVGTELAVIIYFRKDIVSIIGMWLRSLTNKSFRSEPEARMGWYVILGTLPIAVLGIVFKDAIETTARNLWVVALALVIMGLILGYADSSARHIKSDEDLKTRHAIIFGLGQAMALIPGVSRSGATITFGLFMGFKREVAARYSFLLAIPAVLASALLEVPKIGSDTFVNWPATLVSTVIAFVVGYAVIARLMTYIKTASFKPFVIYRVVLGVILIGLLVTGTISAT